MNNTAREIRRYVSINMNVFMYTLDDVEEHGAFLVPDRILNILWKKFSNDQAANELIVDAENVLWFTLWLQSEDPNSAWS